MTANAFYEGWVRHRRKGTVTNAFRYGTYMTYLDLEAAEAGALPHPQQRRFRREDHGGEAHRSLSDCIRDEAKRELGYRPEGPIFVLTHLRQGGYVFNPVSFFYLWSCDGLRLEAVVAEVHNTPWGETHFYPVPVCDEKVSFRFKKNFHVSPFMRMDQEYEWTFTIPQKRLVVHMRNLEAGRLVFDATLVLFHRALTRRNQWAMAWRHPLTTYATIGRIYFQALKLWVKGARYFAHPGKGATKAERVK